MKLELELQTGTPLVIQRVGPSTRAADVADTLTAALGQAFAVADTPSPDDAPSVVDLRGVVSFPDMEAARPRLETRRAPMVWLVDTGTAKALLRDAPQTTFWAGGVRLPEPPTVRAARKPDEVEVGRRLLQRTVAAEPTRWSAGETVAIDLASGRIFTRRGDSLPLDVAQEEMDEGLVYLGRIPG